MYLRQVNCIQYLTEVSTPLTCFVNILLYIFTVAYFHSFMEIMVATQNIESFGPNWTFSLRGVLTFVASGLDINGCVLSYFEETAHLHCYTSCTLTTLHCSKVSSLQCCPMKIYNKIFTKNVSVYSLLWDTVYINIYNRSQIMYYVFSTLGIVSWAANQYIRIISEDWSNDSEINDIVLIIHIENSHFKL